MISNLYTHLGYWHFRFGQLVHIAFERRLAKHDITVSQWCVLILLYHKKASTVRELANQLQIDPGAVTRLADRLAEKKLLKRIPDPDDNRSVRFVLLTKANKLVPLLAQAADDNDAHFFGNLNPKEIKQYKKILLKMLSRHEDVTPKDLGLDKKINKKDKNR